MTPTPPQAGERAEEYMCPNCNTPWKCNGPHIPEGAVSGSLESLAARLVAEFPMAAIVRAFNKAASGFGNALVSHSLETKPVVTHKSQILRDKEVRALQEHIDRYWELAYAEGREGRKHDTKDGDAMRCRHEIERSIRTIAAQAPAPEETK